MRSFSELIMVVKQIPITRAASSFSRIISVKSHGSCSYRIHSSDPLVKMCRRIEVRIFASIYAQAAVVHQKHAMRLQHFGSTRWLVDVETTDTLHVDEVFLATSVAGFVGVLAL